jgi:uncharacterized repeat protein (TIGR03803 family)
MRSASFLLLLAATLFTTLALAPAVQAQTVTNIRNYDFPQSFAEGGNPWGNLVQASDGNLYGTALCCGPSFNSTTGGTGVIFKITPAGEYSILYACGTTAGDCNGPLSLLQLLDGNLYGVSAQGGANGYGDIFRVTLSGAFADLHDFSNTVDGEYPNGGIIAINGDFGLTIIGSNSGRRIRELSAWSWHLGEGPDRVGELKKV